LLTKILSRAGVKKVSVIERTVSATLRFQGIGNAQHAR